METIVPLVEQRIVLDVTPIDPALGFSVTDADGAKKFRGRSLAVGMIRARQKFLPWNLASGTSESGLADVNVAY